MGGENTVVAGGKDAIRAVREGWFGWKVRERGGDRGRRPRQGSVNKFHKLSYLILLTEFNSFPIISLAYIMDYQLALYMYTVFYYSVFYLHQYESRELSKLITTNYTC